MKRITHIISALCGAAAVALMLSIYYQPMIEPCDRCALAVPWSAEWWACLVIGCW